ncbi:hypothetical protein G3I76_07880, partial [Streptomyces sp. SID11233]|nr:hypothetical protein [Streptomyces sp. SID11233]
VQAPAQDTSKGDDAASQGGGEGADSGQSAAPKEQGQNDDGSDGATAPAKPSGARCDTSEIDFDFWAPHGGKPDMEQSKYQQSVTVRLTNH